MPRKPQRRRKPAPSSGPLSPEEKARLKAAVERMEPGLAVIRRVLGEDVRRDMEELARHRESGGHVH